jgi:hypothetical protein
MRYTGTRFLLALLPLLAGARLADAQIGPLGWDNYGAYGSWDAYSTSSVLAQNAQLASSSRAQQQNYVMQTGIRSTLTQQAQAQAQNQANQRQDYKDWWYQTQAQQAAAGQARSAPSRSGSTSFVSYSPSSAVSVIQWPILLQDPIFTKLRATVEAPYLYNPDGPSADDFKDMVKTVAQMKDLVTQKLAFSAGTPEEQAKEADKFLDQLAKEASSYATQLDTATRGAAPATTPAKKTAEQPKAGK